MRIITWNVNGLRAVIRKEEFYPLIETYKPDILCLQETKMQQGQADIDLPDYHEFWNSAERKGYSGTAVFSKPTPHHVKNGIGYLEHDDEGRVITAEYEDFYLVNCYTPNAQNELARLDYRLQWEKDFLAYLQALDAKKPVILCGDLNVAHQEIDLKNPGPNRKNAGFSDEERAAFTRLLEAGYVDVFRHFYPDVTGAYTWWSYRFNARKNNAGWRIDYFVVSQRFVERIERIAILNEVFGSDHCPVFLDLK